MIESASNKRAPVWLCLLAASIPVAYIFAYLSVGRVFPQWDPAEYMETGLRIYNVFVDQGWVEGLKALYLHRGWRPSLTPLLIVPFFALTGGRALAAMHIVCPLLYALLLCYVTLLLRTVLQGGRLVFALLLMGTHITLVAVGLDYWSELPYCVAAAAAVYHFHRCDFFKKRRHCVAAGIALGLALCFRPIVGMGTFAVPVAIYLWLSLRKDTIRWRDAGVWLFYGVAGMAIAAFLLLLPNNKSWFGFGLLGSLIAATVALVSGTRRRFGLNDNNLVAVSAAFALTVGWFGLFAAEVYSWTFTNTFGDLVRVTLNLFPHPREEPLAFIRVIGRNTVTPPSLGLFAVVAVAALIRVLRRQKLSIPGSTALLVSAICIVPLLGTLITYNGDPRYLIVPAFVLILSCTAWFLMGAGSRASAGWRIAVLSPALIVQVVFLASRMAPLPGDLQERLEWRLLTSIFPLPMSTWRDRPHPAEPVYEQIREAVGESSKVRVGVINPKAFAYLTLPVVNLLATENGENVVLSLASELVPTKPGMSDEDRVRYLRKKFTHLLIGPLSAWEAVPDPIRSVGSFLLNKRTCHEHASVLVPGMEPGVIWEFVMVKIDARKICTG